MCDDIFNDYDDFDDGDNNDNDFEDNDYEAEECDCDDDDFGTTSNDAGSNPDDCPKSMDWDDFIMSLGIGYEMGLEERRKRLKK